MTATKSDSRVTTDIVDLPSCLQKVMGIRPVQFKFIYDENTNVSGFIAQEYVQTFPEFTMTNPGDDGVAPIPEDGMSRPWTVMTDGLIPFLVGAIKELNAKIEALQAQINGGT